MKTTAKAILQTAQELNTRRTVGDFAASDTIIDFAAACKKAELTPGQREAITLVYLDGYTQQEAADLLGVERSTVAKRAARAIKSLDEIYYCWAYMDEARGTAA